VLDARVPVSAEPIRRLVAGLVGHGDKRTSPQTVTDLSASSTNDGVQFVRNHLSVRSVLNVAPGVIARSPINATLLALVRSDAHLRAGDRAAAIESLTLDDPTTVTVLAWTALCHDDFRGDVLSCSAVVTNVDSSTALLCVARAVALETHGQRSAASDMLAEALRLPRTASVIQRRAVLTRALLSARRGHLGRALEDLVQARASAESEDRIIDGLDATIRRLRRRRRP